MTDLARTPKQIGNRIRRSRKALGLSQADLGEKAGFRQETISLIETGHAAAKLETILTILAALDLELRIAPRSKSTSADIDGYVLMPRHRQHAPLRVLLNNRLVGHLAKAVSGAIEFQYDRTWLDWPPALPISLSLPLREDAYRGEPVAAVFDNLLPDADALRRSVAEKVGAAGIDAYTLMAVAALGAVIEGVKNFTQPWQARAGQRGIGA